jgi:hypothetical protein
MTRRLVETAVALADTLARENAALAAMDLGGAARLLEEKQAALARFAAAQETPPLDAAERALALQVGERLQVLAAENKRLLERALRAQTRVLGIVAGAARVATSDRYAASGTRAPARAAPAVVLSARA